MRLQREAGTRARRRNLKLVNYLLPELVLSDALEATAQNGCLKQLAEIELFTSDLWDFEIFDAQVLLELNQFFLELFALALLIFIFEELQLFGQSYAHLVAHIGFQISSFNLQLFIKT